jgi:addiction module HigA family antidote
MAPHRLSANALARALGVPVTRISEIVRGRRGMTADTALRLARFFGTTPDFWLGLQADFDLRRAHRQAAPEIARIPAPDRARVVEVLSRHRANLRRRFAVRSLSLFGSTARGDPRPDSDVDLLVDFATPPGFDGYMALKWHLEYLLQAPIDLVMEGALEPEARALVEAEAVRVA